MLYFRVGRVVAKIYAQTITIDNSLMTLCVVRFGGKCLAGSMGMRRASWFGFSHMNFASSRVCVWCRFTVICFVYAFINCGDCSAVYWFRVKGDE